MSLWRVASPRSCSGAVYASLPLNVPSRVTCAAIVAFATPKSSRRAVPSAATITFCGETSRWTMSSGVPISSTVSCAACRPASTWHAIDTAIVDRDVRVRLPRLVEQPCSGAPCTYSCTRMTSSPVVTTSSTGTTLRWWTCEAMRASSRNIATNSASSANSGSRRLAATMRLKPSSPIRRAMWIVAMPPRAIWRWSR